MEQASVGQQHTEDICQGKQLDQDRKEIKMQHRDRLSLRSGTVLFLELRRRLGVHLLIPE